jgi:DNA-binding IclR family transcriptional regulator
MSLEKHRMANDLSKIRRQHDRFGDPQLRHQRECRRQENRNWSSALPRFSPRRRSIVAFTNCLTPREVVPMDLASTASKVIEDRSQVSAGAESPPTAASQGLCAETLSGASAGRRVLDGAFAVLEALASADGGLGLTAVARASGLAKTSAYRLAEQLVALGAVQRIDHRYYVGARIARIGQRWQPDPLLRRAAHAPVHALALRSGATASLRILYEGRFRVICATMHRTHAWVPTPADPESAARTATGRVLYATQPVTDVALPECWTPREWRQLRDSLRDLHTTVVDHQQAFAGICCVSAPVWRPDGTCAGAVTVVLQGAKPGANLRDLVVCAARRIGAELR